MKSRSSVCWYILTIVMAGCIGTPTPVAFPPESSESSSGLAQQIDAYLTGKDSPLAGYGADFVAGGEKFGVDPRLIVAIAGAETGFGIRICATYNAWNWFYNDTSNCENNAFASWKEGIERVTRGLGGPNYLGGGLTSIEEIAQKYTTTQRDDWIRNVTIFYHNELGGDLNNLVFKQDDIVVNVAPAGASPMAQSQALEQSSLNCDPQIYYGVWHCSDVNGNADIIVVDLTDIQHVRVQTVLPMGPKGECNSVNGNDRDNSPSNCPFPYPLERITSMLERYKDQNAVAIINTDFFGCGDKDSLFPCGGYEADHGAQGLAVRNGIRLDGPEHGVTKGKELAYEAPSLAISPSNAAIIGIPGSQAVINSNLAGRYYNTVGGSPLLIEHGQVINNPCNADTHKYGDATCIRPSQSAAGLTSDGRLVLITARMDAINTANYLTINYPLKFEDDKVHIAIKFDAGGSARLAWVDSSGIIQSFGGTQENRPVAQALLVFSQKMILLVGEVSGLIKSKNGEPVEGASVQLLSEGKTLTTKTGVDGHYQFSEVTVGSVSIRASKLGVGSASVEVTIVDEKGTEVPDIYLKPGIWEEGLEWIQRLAAQLRDVVILIIMILTFPIWFPIVLAIIRIILGELNR